MTTLYHEERVQAVRDRLYESYGNIYCLPLRIQAIDHTSKVEACARLLAARREVPADLAVCAALLHDMARYLANVSKHHAQKGACMAEKLLRNTALFSEDEMKSIVHAIACHSDKSRTDDPLSEVLKDADTLAFWAASPHVSVGSSRSSRLKKIAEELTLPKEALLFAESSSSFQPE